MVANFLNDVSDAYSRRARLFPGLLITLPCSLLAVVLITTVPAWWSPAVLLLSASGAAYFGAQLVRTAGRRSERYLWEEWGGAPTTQLLRFRGASNRVQVQRRHDQLGRLFPDLPMPDDAMESNDPRLADEHYEAAVRALIERSRDRKRFERVFDELCQYGFRRNLWGCRDIGRWLAGASLVVVGVLGLLGAISSLEVSTAALAAAASLDILLLLALTFVVSPGWVREAAEAYAVRLLASLEVLDRPGEAPVRDRE